MKFFFSAAILTPSWEGFAWVVAICLSIVILDSFFQTELLSHLAIIGNSIYFALLFDFSIKWTVCIALIAWLLTTILYYLVWSKFIRPSLLLVLGKGAKELQDDAEGQNGIFRIIEEESFVKWNGDLWPVADESKCFNDGDKVIIESCIKGIIKLKTK